MQIKSFSITENRKILIKPLEVTETDIPIEKEILTQKEIQKLYNEIEDTVTNGDETVRLSTLLKEKAGYRYLEELGTKPRVYYLPPVDRMFPFDETKENS